MSFNNENENIIENNQSEANESVNFNCRNKNVLPSQKKSDRVSLWHTKPKENVDINGQLNFKFINETEINNGSVLSADKVYEKYHFYADIYNPENNQILFSKTYTNNVQPLSLDDLRKYYNAHNNSIEETQNYLQEFIKSNKDNEALIRATISKISDDLNKHFDHSGSVHGVGGPVNGLEQCINANSNQSVKGLICGSICDIMRYQLEQCGFKTAIVPSMKNERHAVLTYKLSDGIYIFNNYGENVAVKADNIKDAVAVYHKNDGTLHSESNRRITNTKETYSDAAYKDAAYRGEEFSKHSYNNENPFNQQSINENTSLKANILKSNLNNYAADVSFDLYRKFDNKNTNLLLSAGMKKMGESSSFHESTSFGIKSEYKSIKYKNNLTKTNDIKVLFSHIQGKTGGAVYSNSSYETVDAEYARDTFIKDFNNIDLTSLTDEQIRSVNLQKEETLSHFNLYNKTAEPKYSSFGQILAYIRGVKSIKKNIVNNEHFELNSGIMASSDIYYTVTTRAGDARLAGDAGIEIVLKDDKQAASLGMSGGILAELNEPVEISGRLINFGKKINTQANYNLKPNNDMSFGINGNAYYTDTKGSDNYGASINAVVSYKKPKQNITFEGATGYNFVGEKIKLGFNEQTESNSAFNVRAGVSKGNTTIYAGYENYHDALNKTRSYSAILAGVKFSLGHIKL